MKTLDDWLKQATRGLANESADRVRAENQQRYDSARAAAISQSADPIAAESIAVAALGDAHTANFPYRCALLTATEARILRQGARESDFIVSHPWFRFLFLTVASASCVLASALLVVGWTLPGRLLLALGLGAGFVPLIPFFPVSTPTRSLIFRFLNWAVQILALLLAFGPGGLNIYWLPALCVVQMIWSESIRMSIRRKLPVSHWPPQLYV
jgi:hypothetical protein